MASGAGRPPGRFLPPDPRVEEPYLFTPRMAVRIAILGAVALVVFAILLLRLWSLQILSGTKYEAAALNNQLRTLRVEAPRGPILDRDGRTLVTNVAATAVDALAGRPAEAGPLRGDEAAGDGPERAAPEAARAARAGASETRSRRSRCRSPSTSRRSTYLGEHAREFPGVTHV